MTIYLPTPVIPPSGFLGNYTPYINSGVFLFETTVDDCLYLSTFESKFSRIFEGNSSIYIYNTVSGVLTSTDYLTFHPIISYATSITQLESGADITTLIFQSRNDITTVVKSQKYPETYNNWTTETTLQGVIVSDSLSDSDAITGLVDLPTLIGNSRSNTYFRIWRNIGNISPIGNFTESDGGIPQILPTIALITDLESAI